MTYGSAVAHLSRKHRVPAGLRVADAEPILDALAAEAGSSRAHVPRAFKRVVGMTPPAYCHGAAGSTIRYGVAACSLGRVVVGATAAARACGANRLAVAVPCHRVVRADGQLSGYRWGVERKRALLQREGGARSWLREASR